MTINVHLVVSLLTRNTDMVELLNGYDIVGFASVINWGILFYEESGTLEGVVSPIRK